MFGYIRPFADEMRVKEYACYRAVYCGICQSMRKHISPLLSCTLRYDFVLLAMVRMLLTGEETVVEQHRCIAHPMRRRPMMQDNAALAYVSDAAAMLTYFGILDNVADERGMRRFAYRAASVPFSGMYRKAGAHGDYAALISAVTDALETLSALEKAGEPSPDAAAEPFGALLGAIFAHGFDGSDARIAWSIGHHVGRFIYLCDAADDAPKDVESGSYNPYVCAAKEEYKDIGDYLRENRERMECALRMECTAAYRALLLLDGAESHPAYPCMENILLLGMPKTLLRVLDTPGGKRNDEKRLHLT